MVCVAMPETLEVQHGKTDWLLQRLKSGVLAHCRVERRLFLS